MYMYCINYCICIYSIYGQNKKQPPLSPGKHLLCFPVSETISESVTTVLRTFSCTTCFFIIITRCSHQSRFRFIKRAHREIVQVYTLALLKVVHTHTVYSRSIQNVDISFKLVFAATVYAMLE